MSLGGVWGGGWGGLKYPLPPMKFLLKAKILEKNGIFEEIFDFFG